MAKKYLDYEGLKTFWRIIKGRFDFKGDTGITVEGRNINLKPASNSEIGGIKTKGGFIKYSGVTSDDEILESTVSTIGETPQNFVDVNIGATTVSLTEHTAIVTLPITPTPSDTQIENKKLATRYYVDHKVEDLNKTMVHRIKLVDELPTEIKEEDLLNTYIVPEYKEEDNLDSNDFTYYDQLVVTDTTESINNISHNILRIFKLGSTGQKMGNSSWPESNHLYNGYVFSKEYKLLYNDTIYFSGKNLGEEIRQIIVDRNYNILNSDDYVTQSSEENFEISYTNENPDSVMYVKVMFYMDKRSDTTSSDIIVGTNYNSAFMQPLNNEIGSNSFKITVSSEEDVDVYSEYIYIPKLENDELVKDGENNVQGKWEKIGSSKDKFTLGTISDSEINVITSDTSE